jgi:hypothetical protein
MLILADAGVPMIMVFLPSAWLALLPVIAIEAAIGMRMVQVPFRRSLGCVAVGNLFSTILGMPATWLILAVIELMWFGTAEGLGSVAAKIYAVTIQSPWLIPYEDHLAWMMPVAAAVLAVIFYTMSVVSEYFIIRRILPDISSSILWRWMWTANAASYVFLLMFIFAALWLGPAMKWITMLFAPITNWLVRLVFVICGLLS